MVRTSKLPIVSVADAAKARAFERDLAARARKRECRMRPPQDRKPGNKHACTQMHNMPSTVRRNQHPPAHAADARRRAGAFGRALAGHVSKLRNEPSSYGGIGVAELLNMREECLREFGFKDVYRYSSSKALCFAA